MALSLKSRLSVALSDSRLVALLIALAAGATIAGALFFEHVLGYVPCKLCLEQRWPYYLGVPAALLTAFLPRRCRRSGLFLLAAIFAASAFLGAFHAGVEWGFWQGPDDCGGGAGAAPGDVADFLNQLDSVRVVSCVEAAWRFLGLSLAGWNAVISVFLAILAALGASAARRSV